MIKLCDVHMVVDTLNIKLINRHHIGSDGLVGIFAEYLCLIEKKIDVAFVLVFLPS